MSKYLIREAIVDRAIILDAPVKPHEVDRSFEMPKALYGVMVGLFLGFLAVTATGLSSPGLIIPMAIFTVFIVAGFGVPAIWTRLAPDNTQDAMSVQQLMARGIVTNTGLCKGKDAVIQMLILPALILCWGVAVVIIAATV